MALISTICEFAHFYDSTHILSVVLALIFIKISIYLWVDEYKVNQYTIVSYPWNMGCTNQQDNKHNPIQIKWGEGMIHELMEVHSIFSLQITPWTVDSQIFWEATPSGSQCWLLVLCSRRISIRILESIWNARDWTEVGHIQMSTCYTITLVPFMKC